MTLPDVVELGEEHVERGDARIHQLGDDRRGQFVIGFDQNFAGIHVDHVRSDVRAFEVVRRNFHLLDLGLLNFLEDAVGDLAALRNNGIARFRVDRERQLVADNAVLDLAVLLADPPVQLLVLEDDVVGLIERAQNFRVGLQSQRAKKNGAVEFPFAVDTNVEQVLDVVFEFDPASAVGDDLAEEIPLRLLAFEEHARASGATAKR